MTASVWPPAGVDWYYSDDAVAIAHADCRDVLPLLGPVDLVLTDPPYGVGLDTKFKTAQRGKWAANRDFVPVYGDDQPFDPSPWLAYQNVVLWGAQYYADKLPPRGQWLVWDKRDGVVYNDQADCELAWTKG